MFAIVRVARDATVTPASRRVATDAPMRQLFYLASQKLHCALQHDNSKHTNHDFVFF
jgi:hypothetical protein